MDSLLARISELPQWQIALAATWLLLQACVVPSLPEEIVTTTMGMLVAQGRVTAPIAMVAVLAGLLPANSAAVFIGSLARRRIGHTGFLGRTLSSPRVAAAACVQVPLLLWLGSRLGEGATAPEAWARIGWASAGLVGAALAVVVTRRAMVSVRAA